MRLIKLTVSLVIFVIYLSSCEIKTEPISYGKDACNFCKMGIVDHQFAAEAVSDKGKVFKFDDVSCLVKFVDESDLPIENYKFLVVKDYEGSDQFVNISEAHFIYSESLKSPMRGDIAAFKNEQVAHNFVHEDGLAIELTWEEVQNKFIE